jgi:hypothetical protein
MESDMNTVRNLSLPALILLLCAAAACKAEVVTITERGFQTSSQVYTNTYARFLGATTTVSNTVVVRSGEVANVLHLSSYGDLRLAIGTTNAGDTNVTFSVSIYQGDSPVVVGPAVVLYTGLLGSPMFTTLKIARNDEPFVPNGAVLVPADTAGPVNVIMESSTNLVTWTPALPGTYGSTSMNQYFRVRAVHQ